MKRSLSMLIVAAVFVTSCTKSSNTKPTSTTPLTPSILLTKIINNTAGDQNVGKTIAEFTYNGKQLSKATLSAYAGSFYYLETHLFNYDNQGKLTSTSISHLNADSNDEVSSSITYSGDNISEIKFYKAGGILDKDILLTYQNGKLTNWFNKNEVNESFVYDNTGNNTSQNNIEYQYGTPDGSKGTTTNTTFDTKSNLSQSIPFWIYFRTYNGDQSWTYTPGTNNPLNVSDNATNFTYNYQYNSYGFPSTISWTDSYPQSYQYEYIQVK